MEELYNEDTWRGEGQECSVFPFTSVFSKTIFTFTCIWILLFLFGVPGFLRESRDEDECCPIGEGEFRSFRRLLEFPL